MKLQELHIANFRQFVDQRFAFSCAGPFDDLFRTLYGSLSVTVLVGVNGSGKTTLLSFLSNVFHNLQRFHGRIPSDFELSYEHDDGQEVRLSKCGPVLHVEAPGRLPRSVLDEWNPDVRPRLPEDGHVSFDQVESLFPRVIVSAFSVHGEYPAPRAPNYRGAQLVRPYDTAAMYGKNHYSLPSLSLGIARLVRVLREDQPQAEHLQRLLGIRFTGQVRVFAGQVRVRKMSEGDFQDLLVPDDHRAAHPDAAFHQPEDVTPEILAKAEEGELYLNDVIFERAARPLSLANMSAGEKMLFIRLLSILSAIEANSIVLIEEPELHLDPAWTKQIITLLHSFFSSYKAHFVVSTHSYAFINTVFPNNILVIDGGRPLRPTFNTFLASESEISARLFRSFREPNYLEGFIREVAATSDAVRLRTLLDALGESHIRFEVFRRLATREGGERDVEGHER